MWLIEAMGMHTVSLCGEQEFQKEEMLPDKVPRGSSNVVQPMGHLFKFLFSNNNRTPK